MAGTENKRRTVGLAAVTPLGGASHRFAHCSITEASWGSLLSLAVAQGKAAAFGKAVRSGWGMRLPEPGRFVYSADRASRLIWTQPDQFFLMGENRDQWPERHARETLGNTGYVTDQSDSWAALSIEGKGAVAALERICPLDLHASRFPAGSAARTVMEHVGIMILREAEDRFMLLAMRSYGRNLLHMVEVSARNTEPEAG